MATWPEQHRQEGVAAQGQQIWAELESSQDQWIEAQAAHLLKRAYFEPHWSRRRGQVMAWEQVSLFGLILRERRLVAYTAVDASVARRLFIEHALVRGELDSRAPFLDANRLFSDE